jgi:hypothetical protein
MRRSDFSCPGSLSFSPRFPVPASRAGGIEISPGSWAIPVHVSRAAGPGEGGLTRTPGAVLLRFGPAAVAFHQPRGVGPHCVPISGLLLATHAPVVYASQSPSRCRPRKTHSRRWSSTLPGRDSHPRIATKGFGSLHCFLLFQAFLAQAARGSGLASPGEPEHESGAGWVLARRTLRGAAPMPGTQAGAVVASVAGATGAP